MTFYPVALYTEDGDFVGSAVMGEHKLQSTNVYAETESKQFHAQLDRLNGDVDIRRHWPHPQDPAVVALLDDQTFMPIEYVEEDVVDEDNSKIVYQRIAGRDEDFNPAWEAGDEIDHEASVISYKKAQVPKRPTDVMWRIKKACEQVARQRADLV